MLTNWHGIISIWCSNCGDHVNCTNKLLLSKPTKPSIKHLSVYNSLFSCTVYILDYKYTYDSWNDLWLFITYWSHLPCPTVDYHTIKHLVVIIIHLSIHIFVSIQGSTELRMFTSSSEEHSDILREQKLCYNMGEVGIMMEH